MRRRLLAAGAVALAITGHGATLAWAQDAGVDPRWQPWIGCWVQGARAAPDAARDSALICVIPTDGRSAVDIVRIEGGAIVTRERIDASGERRPSTRSGCDGFEQAEWSADGRRVYLLAEHRCPGGAQRRASGMLAFAAGKWLDVQSVAVGAYPGVRVVRYREAVAPDLPAEVARALRGREPDYWALRVAAGGDVGPADVMEAAEHLDAVAVESWLVERGERFDLDAGLLLELADGGVPTRVIDVMVALSYPAVFTVSAVARGGGARVDTAVRPRSEPDAGGYGAPAYDDRYYSPFGWSPYAYGYGGWGYDGWYWGNRPVIIVVNGGGGAGVGGGGAGSGGERHGKVVNGRGYSGGDNTGPQARPSNPGSTGTGSVSSGGYAQPRSSGGGSAGSSGSGSGGSSSSGSGRTAQPRP